MHVCGAHSAIRFPAIFGLSRIVGSDIMVTTSIIISEAFVPTHVSVVIVVKTMQNGGGADRPRFAGYKGVVDVVGKKALAICGVRKSKSRDQQWI